MEVLNISLPNSQQLVGIYFLQDVLDKSVEFVYSAFVDISPFAEAGLEECLKEEGY